MEKKENIDGKGFGWKVLALSVLLIIALSSIIFFGINVVVGGVGIAQLAVMLLSIAVAAYSISTLIRLNRNALDKRYEKTFNGLSVFIAKWEIPAPIWEDFTEKTFQQSKKEAKSLGVVVGLVFVFVFMLIAFREFSIPELLLWAGAVFLGFFLVAFVASRIKSAKDFQRSLERSTGEVQFGDRVIIYNGELIFAENLGSTLVSFGIESRFGIDVVAIEVIGGYGRRGRRKHIVPIPKSSYETARELLNHFPPTFAPKRND